MIDRLTTFVRDLVSGAREGVALAGAVMLLGIRVAAGAALHWAVSIPILAAAVAVVFIVAENGRERARMEGWRNAIVTIINAGDLRITITQKTEGSAPIEGDAIGGTGRPNA